jgi:hypothetical protein
MFPLHNQHLADIKGAVAHFGEIRFHGDGNIYQTEQDSDFRKDFSNDPVGPHTYRVRFDKNSILPKSLDELAKMLQASKTQEAIDRAKPKEQKNAATFVSTPYVEEPEEVKEKVKK